MDFSAISKILSTCCFPFAADLFEEREVCTYLAVGVSASDPSKAFDRSLVVSSQAEKREKIQLIFLDKFPCSN